MAGFSGFNGIVNRGGMPSGATVDLVAQLPASAPNGSFTIVQTAAGAGLYTRKAGTWVLIAEISSGGTVSGSGTAGTIPIFTAANVLGDSMLSVVGGNLTTAASLITTGNVIINRNAEALTLNGTSPLVAGFDAAGSIRSGFINFESGAGIAVNIGSETGSVRIQTGGANRIVANAAGRILINGAVDNTTTTFQVSGTGLFSGALTANSFIKAGGTSAQFLKADGSVDSSSYISNLTGPITSVGNATSIAAQTGTGSVFVVQTSPTLITPVLGVATGTSLNLSGTLTANSLVKAGGTSAQFLKADGSVDSSSYISNLTGPITSVGNATSIAAQTGTGSVFVVQTSPTLITPVLGVATGTSLNLSGTLTANSLVKAGGTSAQFLKADGSVDSSSYISNLTGPITSVGNATSIAAQTGTGSVFVVQTSPTLITPVLGVATGTSLNLSGTLTANSLVKAGGTSAQFLKADGSVDSSSYISNLTGPITSVGNATSIAAQTGTGSVFVVQTSPTLITPVLGVATGTSLNLTGRLGVNGAQNVLDGIALPNQAYVYFYAAGTSGAANAYIRGNGNNIELYSNGLINLILASSQNSSALPLLVPDQAYSSGWDTDLTVPTKNAIWDVLGSLAPINWTPVCSVGGSTVGGEYTVIGKQVFAYFQINVAVTVSTAQLKITGLPFSPNSSYGTVAIRFFDTGIAGPGVYGNCAISGEVSFTYTTGPTVKENEVSGRTITGCIIYMAI